MLWGDRTGKRAYCDEKCYKRHQVIEKEKKLSAGKRVNKRLHSLSRRGIGEITYVRQFLQDIYDRESTRQTESETASVLSEEVRATLIPHEFVLFFLSAILDSVNVSHEEKLKDAHIESIMEYA